MRFWPARLNWHFEVETDAFYFNVCVSVIPSYNVLGVFFLVSLNLAAINTN